MIKDITRCLQSSSNLDFINVKTNNDNNMRVPDIGKHVENIIHFVCFNRIIHKLVYCLYCFCLPGNETKVMRIQNKKRIWKKQLNEQCWVGWKRKDGMVWGWVGQRK